MGVIAGERRRFGGWTFEIGEKSGSAKPGEVGVWLVKAPASSGLATGHLRSFFFEPAAWNNAQHFRRKVARDESYRGGMVKQALAFQKRDRIFERSLAWMDTSVDFGPRSAVAAGPGVSAAQGRANLAAMRLAPDRRDDLVRDMVEVLTSFSARLYGRRRSARNWAEKALRCAKRDVGPMALSHPDAKASE